VIFVAGGIQIDRTCDTLRFRDIFQGEGNSMHNGWSLLEQTFALKTLRANKRLSAAARTIKNGNYFVSRNCGCFLQDENLINRPVCSYVQPLRAGRLLEHPRQAARFVSLIKFTKAATVGSSNKTEQWSSLHSFLAANKGVGT